MQNLLKYSQAEIDAMTREFKPAPGESLCSMIDVGVLIFDSKQDAVDYIIKDIVENKAVQRPLEMFDIIKLLINKPNNEQTNQSFLMARYDIDSVPGTKLYYRYV